MLTHVILASGVRSCGVGSTRADTDQLDSRLPAAEIMNYTKVDFTAPEPLPEPSQNRFKIVSKSLLLGK